MANKGDKDKLSPVAKNKKAYRDFELLEKFEAGLELRGSEVKSLRGAAADLTGSYARIQDGECWLVGAKIAPYAMARDGGHDPTRRRKVLNISVPDGSGNTLTTFLVGEAGQRRPGEPVAEPARLAGVHAGQVGGRQLPEVAAAAGGAVQPHVVDNERHAVGRQVNVDLDPGDPGVERRAQGGQGVLGEVGRVATVRDQFRQVGPLLHASGTPTRTFLRRL